MFISIVKLIQVIFHETKQALLGAVLLSAPHIVSSTQVVGIVYEFP
jgi:predicted cobalt transporter CbtA